MAGELAKIKQQIFELEKKAQELVRAENSKVIERVKGLIAKHGLTAADLGLVAVVAGPSTAKKSKRRRGAASKGGRSSIGAATYRDPASGKTWTGRGKPPAWIAAVEDRAPFLISEGSAPTVAEVADSPKRTRAGSPTKAGHALSTAKAKGRAAANAQGKRKSSKRDASPSSVATPPAREAAEVQAKPPAKAKPKRAASTAAPKKRASARAGAAAVVPTPPKKGKASPATRSRGGRSKKSTTGPSSAGAPDSKAASASTAG